MCRGDGTGGESIYGEKFKVSFPDSNSELNQVDDFHNSSHALVTCTLSAAWLSSCCAQQGQCPIYTVLATLQ